LRLDAIAFLNVQRKRGLAQFLIIESERASEDETPMRVLEVAPTSRQFFIDKNKHLKIVMKMLKCLRKKRRG